MTETVTTTIRLPAELRQVLQEMANNEDRSLNNLIVLLLKQAVRDRKKEPQS